MGTFIQKTPLHFLRSCYNRLIRELKITSKGYLSMRAIGKKCWFIAVWFWVALACNYPVLGAAVESTPTAAERTPTVAPTPTAAPLLTICLGAEPTSLFPFGDESTAARAVRQALYDGPIDWVDGKWESPILETIPTSANGQVIFEAVTVQEGDLVVDAQGELVPLQEGTVVLPSGCEEPQCALAFTPQAPFQMDQMVVRFRLRPAIPWADGQPLQAADSVYAFEVLRALYPRLRAEWLERTAAYQALDEVTVEWRGLPGYRSAYYVNAFIHPLPRHLWGGFPPMELLNAESVQRAPLGWGAYAVEEWTRGDHLTLRRNERYFRAGEGLPRFERLVFRFIPDASQALDALLAGECDYLDESVPVMTQEERLRQLESEKKIRVQRFPGGAWEQLLFAVNPPAESGVLPFFQAKEVRQAVALCVDRLRLVQELYGGKVAVPDTYLPPEHPLANAQVRRYGHDPAAAAELLTAAGWVDDDGNPATPRLAQGISGIPDGTPFVVPLLTSDDPERQAVAQFLRQSLQQCGVSLEVQALPQESLFAAGPAGPLFGRNFALALFGWAPTVQPPCALYTSREIPGPYPQYPKGWGGANPGGYGNSLYDQVCHRANTALPESAAFRAAHEQAQAIFAEDLPALPLYVRPRLVVTRPDFCSVQEEVSVESPLWNLEALDYGATCPP